MTGELAAVTGATGFLGRHLLPALAARGLRVRVLSRRDPTRPHAADLVSDVIRGDLEDAPALARLVRGADVVIHAAGLTRAGSRREFLAVNRDGSARLAAVTQREAPGAHLIAVSSLAARMPELSAYAESKRAGEDAVAGGFAGRLSVLRPPVVYGPWDKATLAIFRAAARPIVPVPGPKGSRIAMIHVGDAAAAIASLAARGDPAGIVRAIADDNPQGYSPRDILGVAAGALGKHPRFVPVPGPVLRLAGHAADLVGWARRRPGVFGAGKVREMMYADWSVTRSEMLAETIFRPETGLSRGFASTVAWYRQAGWLA